MKRKFIIIFLLILVSFLSSCTNNNNDPDNPVNDDLIHPPVNKYEEDIMVNEIIYPHDEVVNVNIDIDPSTYQELLDNALDEEYYLCDITYNGFTLSNVAIRTKGHSSLRDVVENEGDRFSYNIDLNYYEDQDLFGIDKLILNNLYKDPTMMVEYITYEALNSIGTVSSRTTFVALSINNEYYGLYLSVEHVSNEFLEHNFDNSDGELYKPDNGTGANLDYLGSTINYTALKDKNNDNSSIEEVLELLRRLKSGEDVNEIFNAVSYLKYLAVSTYTVNLDSYQGSIYHNYYLYNNKGVFEWIAWDLNMAFNGFPLLPLTDDEAVSFIIDEPTIGGISNYTLTDTLLDDEENMILYHSYLQDLVDNYFDYETFVYHILDVKSMIDEYVTTDENRFYTLEEYEDSINSSINSSYSLFQFVSYRTLNIKAQLFGEISSTNYGRGNIPISTISGPGNR
ncbi:Inner spore coat protein H [Candidatus Izimaplasma bacterium HR1]|jgi:spore coat protein CotH|uniref:CotH kinase family protein n=1 Tax=Candidatus Izimoplasma sp. HR1 TaxID=1541959 RepID=UPI0004F6CC15|nr:Inner spore coat protein H [Candidatus Izimaplasma bacterium HR1]